MSNPLILGLGRTSGNVNVPIRVGSTGIIDGSGDPVSNLVGSLPEYLLLGRTAGGVNIPILATSDGKLHIVWG